MAALYLLVLAAACFTAQAVPQDPLPSRNTIFLEERLEGGAFEYLNDINDLTFNEASNNPYRLPRTTLPESYKVLWTIDTEALWFHGEVDINLYATQANVNEIVIHAHDLNVTSLSLSLGDVDIPVQHYVFEPQYHFMRVRVLNGVLQFQANQRTLYTLSISFNAPLRTDMYGIYQSWFRNNATDEVSWMASTQFQATAARFAFPCYDEPSFKAIFDVTIRRPSHYSSWFCTRLNDTTLNAAPGYDDDHYHITPIMSTYLLALIVAEYTSEPYYSDDGDLLYEVIARPRAMELGQGQYAFDVGQELLEEMSNHTDYDFFDQSPHLKMTQAAIPDFGAGAMENWGLLTYREAYLMHDEIHTSGYFKQLIAYILSHEIAHMWFGNLVTNDWWDVLWLNEGFARYYQYFLTDWVEEYMGLATRFINEQVHASLLSDSANNAHPLTNPGVGSPGSVSAMFSTITYNKGAAVIRMTEHLLGFDVHREGLRNYLVQREFDTALPIHLFQALQTAAVANNAISQYGSGFNFIEYYRSWTEQGGHPVLNVEVDHSTGQMTIYQRRFNINTGYSTAATNWIVPITFYTASNPDYEDTKPSHIIREAITFINRTTVGDEWVIFNKQQTGFYRVNYDEYTWNLNIIALRGSQRLLIHEYNRAQIVNDVFQFARSGIMTYNRALNIISFLKNETEYTPWVAAITGFNWIRNRLQGSTYLTSFDREVAEWTNYVMNTVGYTPGVNETFMRSYLRYQMAPFVCNLNILPQCRDSAMAQFNNLRHAGQEVPADSRNWVYCNALREGTVEDFYYLWNRFLEHDVYTEKILLLQTLGCTPYRETLFTLLDGIIHENHVIRRQDYTTAFNNAVSGNEGNTQIVFEYIQENLQNVTNAFGSATTPLSYIYGRLRNEAQIEAFQQWADDNRFELGTAYQSVRNGVSNSRANLEWAIAMQSDFEEYLNEGEQDFIPSTPPTVEITQPSTVTPQSLVAPTTPNLPTTTPQPGSANTAVLSALTIALAFVANFAM